VIGAAAFAAIQRSQAVLVALAVQLVAVGVVGDAFVSPSRHAVALAPQGELALRAAPLARGERVMTFDLIVDLALETRLATAADAAADLAVVAPAPAAAPAQEEPAARPEPAAPPASRPTPKPRATAAPATPGPPAITSSSSATQQAELRMLALMNASRAAGGLVPLALDAVVSEAARRHSAVEAQYRYVYHDGPDGTARSRYVPVCGSGWYGENTGKVWSGGVDVLHREFMAEPWQPINHRTNIMDPNFRRAGIGAVQGPDAIYITVAFCR
jgi:uncharacterized protein YkwD